MAMETNRSFPRIWCQRLAEIRLAVLSSPKILARASFWCGGSSRVWRRVSTTQPSIPFRVAQLPSPFFIYLSETASRWDSEETSGQASTLSMECRRCRRRTFMRCSPPWPSWMKLSTKTSVCPTGAWEHMLEGGARSSASGWRGETSPNAARRSLAVLSSGSLGRGSREGERSSCSAEGSSSQ